MGLGIAASMRQAGNNPIEAINVVTSTLAAAETPTKGHRMCGYRLSRPGQLPAV